MNTDERLQRMLDERRVLRRRLAELDVLIGAQCGEILPPGRHAPEMQRRALSWSEALIAAKIKLMPEPRLRAGFMMGHA